MNEAHSPLPWSVDNGGVFKDANGDYVGGILFDESADEKFFVHCVNTHAALVEALKGLIVAAKSDGRDVDFGGKTILEAWIDVASEALRQEEEGK